MPLRCVWSYLLCVADGSEFAEAGQLALAWFSFRGKTYSRDGIPHAGAGRLDEALRVGPVQSEAVAWSLGFDQPNLFSVAFEGNFHVSLGASGAYDITGGGKDQSALNLRLKDETLFASLACGPVEVSIEGKWRSSKNIAGEPDTAGTNVVAGLSAFRWRRIDFSGQLKVGDHGRTLGGVAYFQQVHSHIPLLPWDWCFCVFPDGSIAGISTLRVGRDLIADVQHVQSDRISLIDMTVFSRGFFLDGATGRLFRMKRSKVVRLPGEQDTSIRRILASDGQGCRMQIDVTVQSTHSFEFGRRMFPFPGRRFHYRSCAATVQDFSFQNDRDIRDSRFFSTGTCNLERTYGIMT